MNITLMDHSIWFFCVATFAKKILLSLIRIEILIAVLKPYIRINNKIFKKFKKVVLKVP